MIKVKYVSFDVGGPTYFSEPQSGIIEVENFDDEELFRAFAKTANPPYFDPDAVADCEEDGEKFLYFFDYGGNMSDDAAIISNCDDDHRITFVRI